MPSQLRRFLLRLLIGHPENERFICAVIRSSPREAAIANHYKNALWMLSRQRDTENQDIPSWTGFNITTRDKVSVSRDVVQYLPTINAPATESPTIF